MTGKFWKTGKNIGKPRYATGTVKHIDGAYYYVQRGNNKEWIYELYHSELMVAK